MDTFERLAEAENRLAKTFVLSSPLRPRRKDIEEYNRAREEVEALERQLAEEEESCP